MVRLLMPGRPVGGNSVHCCHAVIEDMHQGYELVLADRLFKSTIRKYENGAIGF
jgi:hypothetical protein